MSLGTDDRRGVRALDTATVSAALAVCYFLTYGVTALVAFHGGAFVPAVTGYVLLVALFGLALALALLGRTTRAYEVGLLLSTTLLPVLVVVDPHERELFGYDAYSFTIPALEFLRSGTSVAAFVNADGDWPLFYAVALAFQQFAGIETLTLAKYFTLFVVGVPVVVYAGVSTFAGRRIGFATALSVAATRTLLLFEVKFVDETLAVLFFFAGVVSLALIRRHRRAVVGLVLTLAAVALTHHATSVFFALLVVCVLSADVVARLPIPARFRPQRGSPSGLSLVTLLAVGFVVAGVFFFLAPAVTTELIQTAHGSLFEGERTASPVQSGGGGGIFSVDGVPFRQLVSRSAMVLFGVMSAVCAFGVLSRYQLRYWEFGWVVAAGILSGLYFASLVAGRVVPLDPIRVLLFQVAVMTPPTLSILANAGAPALLRRTRLGARATEWRGVPAARTALSGALVVFLVVTQVAAFAPHVLYTDPDATVLGEGHHTPAQFAASDWTERYYDGAVMGPERSLWVSRENFYRNPVYGPGNCDPLLTVWRAETGEIRPETVGIVFDSTDISVTAAGLTLYVPQRAANSQSSPNFAEVQPECGVFVTSKAAKAL